MFSIDGVEQPNPVIASVGKVSPYSLEIVSKKFLYVKPAAKTVSSDIMFCLPKEGGTVSNLMVVKVNEPGRDTPRDERPSVHPFYDAGKFRQSSGRDRSRNESLSWRRFKRRCRSITATIFLKSKNVTTKKAGWQ